MAKFALDVTCSRCGAGSHIDITINDTGAPIWVPPHNKTDWAPPNQRAGATFELALARQWIRSAGHEEAFEAWLSRVKKGDRP